MSELYLNSETPLVLGLLLSLRDSKMIQSALITDFSEVFLYEMS